MSTQIFYFSGTGNSLHVARELAKRLPETTLVPIIGALKGDKIEARAETVGVVFPIHNLSLPVPVRQFLQRVDLTSADYLFAVATRYCSDKIFADMDTILARQGKSLAAALAVEMPCTYIPLFEIPSQEAIAKMEAALQNRLDAIQAVIADKQTSRERDDLLVFILGHILYPAISAFIWKARFPGMARSFYADSNCTGCGLCERVCLSERIRIKDGQPEWIESIDCTYCFACLHYCPAHAVQIRNRRTVARRRYHHAQINASDIAGQKNG